MRVVEVVGLGPGPFAGMLLADMGADVVRVDRPARAGVPAGPTAIREGSVLNRSKHAAAVDLKDPGGMASFLRLVDRADALIETFRPGVAERLGFGPDVCLARNPGLIYGRLTGFGQDGPWAQRAGHDLDYLALAGALEPLGRAGGPPTPPINVLADFAGGGMLLAFGIACALHARATEAGGAPTGGQVVDAAMVDGAALLMAPFYAGRASGAWGSRGTNVLDGAAPFYDSYECADGRWLAVAAIEPQFYAALLQGLGIDGNDDLLGAAHQYDTARWPAAKARLAGLIATRARNDWVTAFEEAGLDACIAPVLAPDEAPRHPHARARQAFVDVDALPQPAPAPRFSRTTTTRPATGPARGPGRTREALRAWGLDPGDVDALVAEGAET